MYLILKLRWHNSHSKLEPYFFTKSRRQGRPLLLEPSDYLYQRNTLRTVNSLRMPKKPEMLLDQQRYQEGRIPSAKRPRSVVNLNPEMDEAFARRTKYVPEFSQFQQWVNFDNGAQERARRLREQMEAERARAAAENKRLRQQQQNYAQIARS